MKLFLGLIFILLDAEFKTGDAVIGLLPDFVGFFLIMKALDQRNDPWRHLAFGLMLASMVLYVADLVDKSTGVALVFWCLELLVGIGMLVLVHRIVGGRKGPRELFWVLACLWVLALLLGWVPLVGTVCAIAYIVVTGCFLIAVYKPLTGEKW